MLQFSTNSRSCEIFGLAQPWGRFKQKKFFPTPNLGKVEGRTRTLVRTKETPSRAMADGMTSTQKDYRGLIKSHNKDLHFEGGLAISY